MPLPCSGYIWGKNLRPSGVRPHPCRVKYLVPNHLASRLTRRLRRFVTTASTNTSFLLLLVVFPVLLVASPQQTGESPARPVAGGPGGEKPQSGGNGFSSAPLSGTPPRAPERSRDFWFAAGAA